MSCSRSGISNNVNEFTLDLYNEIVTSQPTDNVFMSASGLMLVMGMLHVVAGGNTEKQMAKILKLENIEKDTLLCDMEQFIEKIREGNNSVQLKTANKIYPNSKNVVCDDYIKRLKKHFHSEVQHLDYSCQPEKSIKMINEWVEQQTDGKIKDLVSPDSINPEIAMVVANAIYFKGGWNGPFDPKDTSKVDFFINDKGKVQVDMMKKELDYEDIGYMDDEEFDCKAIELTYTGQDIGLVILLPNKKDGLGAMEKKLTTDVLKQLVMKLNPRTTSVIVSIPKFKLETEYDMKQVLSSLGMTDLFDKEKADLSGMGKGLYVSDVFQKAFIDINEKGTEAAASTWDGDMVLSDDPLLRFQADHPFFFMIWDVPLFIGRLTNPYALYPHNL